MLIWMLTLGCGGDAGTTDVMSDFLLPDVNETSETYQLEVSPRDHLGEASVWYFGHST